MNGQVDSLAAIRQVADHMQPEISKFDDEVFGDFRYCPDNLYNRDFPSVEVTTPDGTPVHVSLTNTNNVVQISCVKVKMDGEWWSVDEFNICIETHADHENDFPQFKFRWNANEKTPERFGALEHAEFHSGRGQFAWFNYEGKGESRVERGIIAEGIVIPESLIGRTAFQGRPLQWSLDVREKEREIINASRLHEFILLVPFR